MPKQRTKAKKASAKRKRLKVLCENQQGRCWICGYEMFPPAESGEKNSNQTATLDHTTPRNTTNGNLRPALAAHAFCNSVRHHKDTVPEKFLAKAKRLFGPKELPDA